MLCSVLFPPAVQKNVIDSVDRWLKLHLRGVDSVPVPVQLPLAATSRHRQRAHSSYRSWFWTSTLEP